MDEREFERWYVDGQQFHSVNQNQVGEPHWTNMTSHAVPERGGRLGHAHRRDRLRPAHGFSDLHQRQPTDFVNVNWIQFRR